jgi:4-hydroxy-4-methyl-2-oxoglutarate aldolase
MVASVAGEHGLQFRISKELTMALAPVLTEEDLDALRQFDTCTIANAIERFNVRLRNTGFTDASIHCRFPDAPPMLGFAVTGRLRSGEPPVAGTTFRDRSDFWNAVLAVPAPRILVLKDMDVPPGRGAFIGDVHAAILKALGCVGYVTNGAVRELPSVRGLGLQLFSASLAVSHAYAHIFDVGCKIEVGGMEVRPGDLLHGDRHGVLTIPRGIAAEVANTAAELQKAEQRVIDFCRSSSFSVAKLGDVLKSI